jgi:hypothetical protein
MGWTSFGMMARSTVIPTYFENCYWLEEGEGWTSPARQDLMMWPCPQSLVSDTNIWPMPTSFMNVCTQETRTGMERHRVWELLLLGHINKSSLETVNELWCCPHSCSPHSTAYFPPSLPTHITYSTSISRAWLPLSSIKFLFQLNNVEFTSVASCYGLNSHNTKKKKKKKDVLKS